MTATLNVVVSINSTTVMQTFGTAPFFICVEFLVGVYLDMLFLPLEELKGKNRNAALAFLRKNEKYCVQLAANLRKNIAQCFVVYAGNACGKNIYGIVSIKKTVLHCLPFANENEQTALQEDFIQSFADLFAQEKFENPVCINGTSSGTRLIIKAFALLENTPSQINEYNLLVLQSKEFLKNLKKNPIKNDYQLIRCKKDLPGHYFSQIFELQKKYELEEVLPNNMEFDEDSCRLRLSNTMRTQYVLALEKDNVLVAKAGTNSIGYKYVQLGGVFTKPGERGRGFAKYVVSAVLIKSLRMHRVPVLFVKKQNEAAVHLYESLFFEKLGDYVIAYY